ncbi:hypothetical protein [Phosphitispora fastidiosa]|uniref:hypothetical protein n=1 Tax=Phosphitispora fastidiosa TaxID=2837202 RepID=UPI001E36A11B|nr:hypothetical protein [Phosphitispora fastidiosa]MBU7007245.1 hypothetical protein [Phosphitispora fastidiosa]
MEETKHIGCLNSQVNKELPLDYPLIFCEDVIKSGKNAFMTASGVSMWPAIIAGMKAEIAPLDTELPPKGALLLVKGGNGLMVHRYWGVQYEKSVPLILTKGDTNICFDPPVPRDLVLGQVVMLKHDSYGIRNPNRGFWLMFGRLLCSSLSVARVWAKLCRVVLRVVRRIENRRTMSKRAE